MSDRSEPTTTNPSSTKPSSTDPGTTDRAEQNAPQNDYATARWFSPEVRVFAAMDTMPLISERVLAIVGEGRVMNKIASHVHPDRLEDLSGLDHGTGLHKGGHDGYPDGHRVWQDDDQAGFAVYLTHGSGGTGSIEGFSAGAYRHNAATEQQVRARYDKAAREDADYFDRRADLTYVKMYGRPGEPNRNDRIEILHWNDHGVLRHTIITFVEPDWCDSGRIVETRFAIVGHRKEADGSRHRYTPGELPEVFATYAVTGEDGSAQVARETAQRELPLVTAWEDVDIAWIVEETVIRERRSVRG